MRREIAVLAFAAILSYFAEALYAPIYAVYVEGIGGSVLDAGLTWGIYMTVLGSLVLILGRYIDKLKRHAWILYFGHIVAGFLSFGYLFIQDVLQLAVLQFLMGLVWAAVNPVWDAYYSLFLDRTRAASEWGLFEGGSRLATGLGSLIGGVVVTFFGFASVFVLAGVLNLLAGIALFLERDRLSVVY